MGTTDNSTVSITIQIVDANSQATIGGVETRIASLGTIATATGEQISSTTKQLVGFNDAIIRTGGAAGAVDPSLAAMRAQALQMQQALTAITTQSIETAAALNAIAEAAQRAGQRIGQGMSHTGASIQGVRLAVQEFGLRVPRAMESAIASNAVLSGALQGTMGIFLAMGALQIGVQMGKDLYDLYEKWIDIDAAVDEYANSVRKSQQEDVVNVHSIEDAKARLDDLNTSYATLLEYAKESQHAGIGDIFRALASLNLNMIGTAAANIGGARSAAENASTAGEQGDKVSAEQIRMQHELATEKINAQHAGDGALQGEAKITAELQKQLALNKENQEFNKRQDAFYGNKTTKDSGATLRNQQDLAAHKTAQAQEVELSRREQEQVIQLQNQATDAGLKDVALMQAQREQAIAAVVRKSQQGELSIQAAERETQALEEKYANERMKQVSDQYDAAAKAQRDASASGLTGMPKIQAEESNKIADLYKSQNGDLGAMYHMRIAIETSTDQEILQARQQFSEKINQIEQSSAAQMTSGYARIAASEKQSLDELGRAYTEFYGADQGQWQGYQNAKTQIGLNSDRQRQQYAQQINEQITQTEAQSARALLPPWQAAISAIEDQYRQRFDKTREELKQGAIDEQQYNREIVVAGALASAEMQKQTMQTRDQIAGQLEQLFNNPAEYLQRRAKQMMMDILANWVEQLMQASPRMQGMLGGLLGMNPVGTNPRTGILDAFGAHKAVPMNESLGMPVAQLTSAGSTLNSAGVTLSSSGTMLMDAASQISAAIQQWNNIFTGDSGSASPITSAGFGGLGGSGSSWTGIGSGSSFGTPSYWGGASGSPEIAGATRGLSGAASLANTVSGGGSSTATGVIGGVQQALQLSSSIRQAFNMGGSAPMLNPSGAFQPSDAAPTNDAGVLGTLPDSGSATSSQAQASGSTGGVAGAFGMAGGLISGGMGLFSAFQQGHNSKTFAGGLMGMATGAMSGAMLGTMFMPGIGTAIGAAAGAMVGLLGDIFGDHGRSKAQQYNVNTVVPGLQQAMDGFNGGNSYDSASQAINSLQMQAIQQCKQWGSGAWSYYTLMIVPEIQNAQAQVDREGAAGRSNVTMSAAQFDSGGVISSFGDFSTGPHSGFIHAHFGERVMNPMASMMFGRTLDAMNAGSSTLSLMQKTAPLGGGAPTGGGGHPVHVHIHTLDARTMDHWARNGGAQWLQSTLNSNASRYAGRALS